MLALTLVAFAAAGHAETAPMAQLIRNLAATPTYKEVAISPDGREVAWVQTRAQAGPKLAVSSEIFVAAVTKARTPVAVSAKEGRSSDAPTREHSPAWSPDGQYIAFLSDARSAGQEQLYTMKAGDHSVRQLTHLKGNLINPQWAPDGHHIAVLFTENSQREAGPLAAVAAPTGVIDSQILEQRIAIVDPTSGATKTISPPDLYVYEYDWSPDSRSFVTTAAHGSGDNNWYVAEIFTIDAASGAAKSILKPQRQIAVPRWSPDQKSIAFITGLNSDESIASGEIHVIQPDGTAERSVTPDLPGSAFWLAWKSPEEIILAEALDGGSAVASVDVAAGKVKKLWSGAETVRGPADYNRGLSLSRDGKSSAVIRESFSNPPAVWYGALGNWKVLSSNTATPSWGPAENIHWRSDEFDVQGWLVAPPHVDPNKKYPMVVWVHGGPAWLTAPYWPKPAEDYPTLLLAAHDYYIFFPNPRGSSGSGEKFKQANIKDFGGGDLRDILAGVKHVVDTHPVDDNRVGITGWSYGGYMTMWALTQTQRFRAGVVGAGLANWQSYYGQNGIDEWMLPYFGASVYDDPAVYAKSSPINFVKQVKTPTLILVGDSDVECPPPQSYEYWHALKTFNVKTQLVIYPNEGHQFQDPEHIIDLMQRLQGWFDDNMPPAGH